MATPAILDFEQLLAPIPGDDPAGVDLRRDSSPVSRYQTVKTAASKARIAARQRREGNLEAEADWSPILKLVPEAIAGKSKDLELAAWLLEALLLQHGYAGLRDGLRLVRELAEKFWDGLYPRWDEDGYVTRLAALAGLIGRDGILVTAATAVRLTGEGPSGGPFVRWHYRQADILQGIGDPVKRQSRIDAGDVTQEMINQAEAATPAAFAKNLCEDLASCLGELEQLDAVLEAKCGKQPNDQAVAPSTSMLRTTLKDCLAIVEGYCAGKVGAAQAGGSTEPSAADKGGRPTAPAASGAIQNREDAFRMLLQVAQFFKTTEPHSPVAYALERAVRWGKMSLPDLLAELIAEESARSNVFNLVGIPPKESSGTS